MQEPQLRTYVLDEGGSPRFEPDPEAWMRWMVATGSALEVGYAIIDGIRVTTLFTGVAKPGSSSPMLWETIVEGGALDGHRQGYPNREVAQRGHELAVRLVRESQERRRINGAGPRS